MTISALFASVFTVAAVAVAPESNLLNNPSFKPDKTGFPAEWCYRRGKTADYVSVKGAELTISPQSKALSFNQGDFHLVPGRRYRFGAEVRTAGTGKRARLVVYNYAWTKESSLSLPDDTKGEWVKIEQEFEAPESRDELYSFTVYTAAGTDRPFSVRAPFLTPADGKIGEEECAPIFSALRKKPPKVLPPPAANDGRRLNTLVRRLAEQELQSGGGCGFSVARDGWVWIALDGGEGTVEIDGSDAGAFAVEGSRTEAMRFVSKGEHSVKVAGFAGKRRLIVNSVPTVMATSYPEPKISGAQRLTGEFLERYFYPAFNTFSYGWVPSRIPEKEWRTFFARGRQMFGHLCRWNKNCRGYFNRMEPPGNLAMRFRTSLGMSHRYYSGLTFDEIAASDLLEKTNFTEALRLSRDLARPIWVWSSGVVYEDNPVNAEYLASIVAASGGRGRLLFECYARTQPDEASALSYFDDYLDGSILRAEKLLPGFVRSSMIVHGAYTRPGGYCTDCRVNVDTKRFWDMYFHRLATSPSFEGLAGIGLYAISNGEEEDLRWASRLIRHYALEGRTGRLSDKYAFRYEPGHLGNGDFADGLEGWTVEAAEPGSIRSAKIKGLASLQGRKVKEAGGDQACVFKRCASKPNVLRRKLAGLEKGRLYSLRFALAPVADGAVKKDGRHPFVFNARIDGAEDVTAASPAAKWGSVDRRAGALSARTLVFKALSDTAELVFCDWADSKTSGGDVGEELALNFVRVVPYYDK
jgi:hypothetical protein